MKLRFYAREDQLVFVPYITVSPGSPERYVGRRFEPRLRGYPATKEPFSVDAESPAGQRLIQLVARDGSLYPADEETAKACGQKRAPKVKYAKGAWVAEASPLEEGDLEVPDAEPVIVAEEVKPSAAAAPAAPVKTEKSTAPSAPKSGAEVKA